MKSPVVSSTASKWSGYRSVAIERHLLERRCSFGAMVGNLSNRSSLGASNCLTTASISLRSCGGDVSMTTFTCFQALTNEVPRDTCQWKSWNECETFISDWMGESIKTKTSTTYFGIKAMNFFTGVHTNVGMYRKWQKRFASWKQVSSEIWVDGIHFRKKLNFSGVCDLEWNVKRQPPHEKE